MLPPSNTLRMQNISVTTTMLEIYCERQQYVNMRESMTKLFFWTTSKAYLNAVIFREATQLTSLGLFIFGENFMEGLPQGGVGSLRRWWVKPREPPYLRHALFFRYLYSVLHFFLTNFLGFFHPFFMIILWKHSIPFPFVIQTRTTFLWWSPALFLRSTCAVKFRHRFCNITAKRSY